VPERVQVPEQERVPEQVRELEQVPEQKLKQEEGQPSQSRAELLQSQAVPSPSKLKQMKHDTKPPQNHSPSLNDNTNSHQSPSALSTDVADMDLWLLHQALYGLREAPNFFQEHLRGVLQKIGWTPTVLDPQLYFHRGHGGLLIAHADDILYAMPEKEVKPFKAALESLLRLKWRDNITSQWSRLLGLE